MQLAAGLDRLQVLSGRSISRAALQPIACKLNLLTRSPIEGMPTADQSVAREAKPEIHPQKGLLLKLQPRGGAFNWSEMDHTLNALPENDPYAEIDLPPSLQSCLDRHRQNLAQLVSSFKSAGISEAEIERSVSIVIASYKA